MTDPILSGPARGCRNVSDRQVGSRWEHQRLDDFGITDDVGEVLEADAPCRLVSAWADPNAGAAGRRELIAIDVEPFGAIARLTVTYDYLTDTAYLPSTECLDALRIAYTTDDWSTLLRAWWCMLHLGSAAG